MLAFEPDLSWNRGIPCKNFKSLINFPHGLHSYFKKVIRGKILVHLRGNMSAFEADRTWNRGIYCKFFKALINPNIMFLCSCYHGHKKLRNIKFIQLTMSVIPTTKLMMIIRYEVKQQVINILNSHPNKPQKNLLKLS